MSRHASPSVRAAASLSIGRRERLEPVTRDRGVRAAQQSVQLELPGFSEHDPSDSRRESKLRSIQVVEQGLNRLEETGPFGGYENTHRSDDSKALPRREPPCRQVVQNHPCGVELRRQGDCRLFTQTKSRGSERHDCLLLSPHWTSLLTTLGLVSNLDPATDRLRPATDELESSQLSAFSFRSSAGGVKFQP